MAVYTDAIGYARTLLEVGAGFAPCSDPGRELRPIVGAMLGDASVHTAPAPDPAWPHVVIAGFAAASQYDRLIRLARAGTTLPHGVACIARTGDRFQGFRGRSWAGSPGNIHLAVHLAPMAPVEHFGAAFMALAAVSVVDAIDSVPGLAGLARIKWVNDVLLGDAKVAGVLAHSQTRGEAVTSVVLGLGLNVETTPAVTPTAFVPAVTSLGDHAPEAGTATEGRLLGALLNALGRNYQSLLGEGAGPLVARYRARSAVLGRHVHISADDPDEVPRILATGRVVGIGDGLELCLAGRAQPITRGRLILDSRAHASNLRAS